MNFRKFILMLTVLALVGVYVWKFEKQQVEPPSGMPFLGEFQEADLKRISVVRASDSYTLEHSDELHSWVLKNPPDAPTDSKRVQMILASVRRLKQLDSIEKEELSGDENTFGLAPPALVLTVEGTFGKKVLSFGKKTGITSRRYAQPQGETRLFLVTDDIFISLDVAKDDVRDRNPIKFDPQAVSEFAVVKTEKEFLEFTRGEKWSLRSPIGELIPDQGFVESKLAEFPKIRVKRFIDSPGDNFALYGLQVPRMIVKIQLRGELPPVVFQLGEGVKVESPRSDSPAELIAGKAYFLKVLGQPVIYELTRPFSADFLQAPDYFRSRTPLAFLADKMPSRIEISESGKPKCQLALEGTSWMKTCENNTDKVNVDSEKLISWLSSLTRFQVLSYPGVQSSSAQDTGLKLPETSYRLDFPDRKNPILLAFGSRLPAVRVDDEDRAPRWVAVSQEDGAFLPAIVNSDETEGLRKGFAQLVHP